jgi:hypothetical protein
MHNTSLKPIIISAAQKMIEKGKARSPKASFHVRVHTMLHLSYVFLMLENPQMCFYSLSQTEQFTVLWVLFATIVLGNSAVLITLYLNKRKSRMNFFIKQLAFAGKYLL